MLRSKLKSGVKSAAERLLSALVCCALAGAGAAVGAQKAQEQTAAPHRGFEPRALQLLQQMAATYARLPGLDQRTEFYSGSVPVNQRAAGVALAAAAEHAAGKPVPQTAAGVAQPAVGARADARSAASAPGREADRGVAGADETGDPPGEKLKRSLHLLAVQPNRMRLELREYDVTFARDQISQWISDGKTFWTYTEENHHYTKDAAPAHLHDFLKLKRLDTGSLELLMLLGVNPFAEVRDQVESVGFLGEATVRGAVTEVVTLRAVQPTAVTEARLYIGKEDHLLHRLVTESTPVDKVNTPGKVGDELDALVDGRGPTPPPAVAAATAAAPQFAASDTDPDPEPEPVVPVGPMKTIMAYDNIITPLARTYYNDFNFVIPDGALLFEPLHLQNDSSKQRKQNLMELFRIAGVKKKKKTRVLVIKGG